LYRLVRKDITRSTTNNVKGTTVQTFEYNGLGQLTRATDNNNPDTLEDDSVVTRKYDSLNRLVEETQNGKVISSNWNEAGNLIDLTYPNERKLAYTQDQLDRLKTITSVGNSSPLASYDYLGSRLIERLFGNNTKLTMLNDAGNADAGYDALGRLVQMRHLGAGNVQIAGFRFGYNRENMKLFQENLESQTQSELYKYDSAYRIANFARGTLNATKDGLTDTASQTQTWQLDGVGNWAATAVDGAVQTQAITSMNEYTSFAGTPQGHSLNGNLTDDGERLFTWDFANRLVEVRRKVDNSLIAQYTYDAFNRRTSKFFVREKQLVTDTQTLALYHFNEENGPVLDSSGNGNNAPAPSDRKVIQGVDGLFDTKAVKFKAGKIDVPYAVSLDNIQNNLTVETWVYLEPKNANSERGVNGNLIHRRSVFQLEVADKDHKAMFTLYTANGKVTVTSNAGLPLRAWLRLAGVYDGSKASLFVGGVRQNDEKPITGNVKLTRDGLTFGGPGFYGRMEEVRLSSTVRASLDGCIRENFLRRYYYSGWRIIEEHERYGLEGQPLGTERVSKQWVDGSGIDEHLTQDVYDATGNAIAQTLWYAENTRGDTVAMTDGQGNVVLRLAYSAYGQAYKIANTGALEDLSAEESEMVFYSFQGRQLDPETGLVYFRQRMYSPEQGRFVSRDPLLYVDGLELHEALEGNPENMLDPMGLDDASKQEQLNEIVSWMLQILQTTSEEEILERDLKTFLTQGNVKYYGQADVPVLLREDESRLPYGFTIYKGIMADPDLKRYVKNNKMGINNIWITKKHFESSYEVTKYIFTIFLTSYRAPTSKYTGSHVEWLLDVLEELRDPCIESLYSSYSKGTINSQKQFLNKFLQTTTWKKMVKKSEQLTKKFGWENNPFRVLAIASTIIHELAHFISQSGHDDEWRDKFEIYFKEFFRILGK
jgi:RHS repeat-associated protein